MSESKKLYRVVVAIAEKRDAETSEIIRDLDVIYDETETTTASKVKPVNIIRRSELAEKLAGIPAEEVLVSVEEVALSCPFLG